MGSGEWGVGNEDEETGVSISLVSEVFNSIQKFHALQFSKKKSCPHVKNWLSGKVGVG